MRWVFTSAHDRTLGPPPHDGLSPQDLAPLLDEHRGWSLLSGRTDALPDLPPEVVAGVRARARAAAQQQMAFTVDLRACGAALDAAGIRWVCVKGPVLGQVYRGAGLLRTYTDIDLLVGPGDFRSALRALSSAGAALMDRNWEVMRSVVPGEVNVVAPHGTVVDLHWSLVNRPARRRRTHLDTEALLETAHRTTVDGVEVSVLRTEERLAHLCLHAAGSGADRALWLLDVTLSVASERVDWARLVEVSRAWGVDRSVGIVLSRCRRMLSAPVPASATRALLRGSAWAAVDLVAWHGTRGRAVPGSVHLAVGSLEHDTPTHLLAASVARRLRRAAPPEPTWSAAHPSGTLEDLEAYLGAVTAMARSAPLPRERGGTARGA